MPILKDLLSNDTFNNMPLGDFVAIFLRLENRDIDNPATLKDIRFLARVIGSSSYVNPKWVDGLMWMWSRPGLPDDIESWVTPSAFDRSEYWEMSIDAVKHIDVNAIILNIDEVKKYDIAQDTYICGSCKGEFYFRGVVSSMALGLCPSCFRAVYPNWAMLNGSL